MEDTKRVSRIVVDKEIVINQEIQNIRSKEIEELHQRFSAVWEEFDELCNEPWIEIEKKGLYYSCQNQVYVLDPNKEDLEGIDVEKQNLKEYFDKVLRYKGLEWEIPALTMLKSMVNDEEGPYYSRKYQRVIYKNAKKYYYWAIQEKTVHAMEQRNEHIYSSFAPKKVRKYARCIPVSKADKDKNLFVEFLERKFVPANLAKESKELYREMIRLYHQEPKQIEIDSKKIKLSKDLLEKISSGEIDSIAGINLGESELKKRIGSNRFSEGTSISLKANKEPFFKPYLECDKKRADMDCYEMVIMEEPSKGHWDLWETEVSQKDLVETDCTFFARNPLCDIREDGIVGIDFGTKSTIVAYQDGKDITQFMRIGKGVISKEIRDDDFENPTVMQFRNITKFMSKYRAKKGRPSTEWNDLPISHTAQEGLIGTTANRSEFHSYMYDLKQWAGNRTGNIKLIDTKGKDIDLSNSLTLGEKDINPIELYAYYIGLYINNMTNGIYLNYLLSFPVSYSKDSKEMILESFKNGIKKSLPNAVLSNKEWMDKFSVKQGAAEPAAYAVCALQQYGFEPKDDSDKIFYGVFDFGGGTTDYDFGVWKYADEDDEIYDYVIQHFGSGADSYLGGENLLERLAYEVFVDNLDVCREKKIVFQKPSWLLLPEDIKFFVNDSQEARKNTKNLMEILRPFWEGKANDTTSANDKQEEEQTSTHKYFPNKEIKVTLFDRDGVVKANESLKIDEEYLKEILYEEIKKGVINFFEALSNALKRNDIKNIESIHIFLAGNSSKSPIVKKCFEEQMKDETERLKKLYEKQKHQLPEEAFFSLYPPLGTNEAKEIQKSKKISNTTKRLTGKTGVAYGLLEVRPGNRIKVEAEVAGDTEAKFKYYLGIKKRKYFIPKIFPENKYGCWFRLIDATEDTFEMYYSTLPEAATGKLETTDISVEYKRCKLSKASPEQSVYIRLVDPVTIEYGVGKFEKEIDKNTITKLCLNK